MELMCIGNVILAGFVGCSVIVCCLVRPSVTGVTVDLVPSVACVTVGAGVGCNGGNVGNGKGVFVVCAPASPVGATGLP